MTVQLPSQRRTTIGLGSLGFLVAIGIVLVAFLMLMLVRPWGSTMPQSVSETVPPTSPAIPKPSADNPEPSTQPQSVIDTSDWKTYRNEEYGFEIQFPHEWSFAELDDNDSDVKTVLQFVPVPAGVPWGDSFHGSIRVHVGIENFPQWILDHKQKQGAAIERVNERYGENFLQPNDLSYEWHERTVADAQTIVEITTCRKAPQNSNCFFFGAPHGYAESWYIYKNNKIIIFSVLTYSLNTAGNKTISEILSTFKFID